MAPTRIRLGPSCLSRSRSRIRLMPTGTVFTDTGPIRWTARVMATETVTIPAAAPATQFTVGPEQCTFAVDGPGGRALYDIAIPADSPTDVPTPASLALLAFGCSAWGYRVVVANPKTRVAIPRSQGSGGRVYTKRATPRLRPDLAIRRRLPWSPGRSASRDHATGTTNWPAIELSSRRRVQRGSPYQLDYA